MNVCLARDAAGILAYERHSLFTEALKFTILLLLRMQLPAWHRLTIALGDGRGGQLFLAVGDGESWDWLRDIEWRS
jgi:hypothetical protein